MNKLHAGLGVLLAGFVVLTLCAQDATPTRENPTVVVGTFDSRGVLMAYISSDAFRTVNLVAIVPANFFL